MLIKVALRNIRSKPIRFLLTSLAVLIGVMLTTAVFIFTDSLRDTFGDLAADIQSGFDVAVRSEIEFGNALNASPVSAEIPDQLQGIEGVAAVQPRVINFTVIPNKANGQAATADGPNIGVNWEDQAAVPRLFLADGEPSSGLQEFMVDVDTAAEDDFIIGDTYVVQTPAGNQDMRLAGTFTFADPDENALVGAKIVAVDTATALELFNLNKGYDDVTITIAAGADSAQVIEDVNSVLPEGLEAVDRQVLVDEQAEGFNEFIDIFRTILLVFAFIILLVAAFVIYNVFSIIVGQRIQEIGLLRALGATGKQITSSIALEALVVGVFATILGVLLGLPVAYGLQKALAAIGFGPDSASTPLRPTTVVVATLLGVGITLLAAIWPALKARQVSPMAALRETRSLDSAIEQNPLFGGLLVVLGGLMVVLGFVLDEYLWLLILSAVAGIVIYLGASRINPLVGRFSLIMLAVVYLIIALTADLRASMLLSLLGSGALTAFLGMNVLSPLFARPVTDVVGTPVAAMGIPGKLARANAGRTPERTSTAASALMIGLALITTVAVVAQSFKATFADVLSNAVTSDWVFFADQGGGPPSGFPTSVSDDLRALPSIDGVLQVKWDQEPLLRTTQDQEARVIYGTELDRLEEYFDIGLTDRVSGSLAGAGSTGVLLHEDKADDLNVETGDTLSVDFDATRTMDLQVTGIYDNLAIFDSGIVIDTALWESQLTNNQDLYVTAQRASGFDDTQVRVEVDELLTSYSQVDGFTKDEFQEEQEGQVDQVLAVINVLLLVSVLLALLGVAITLALSVFERTREIGLTRAVGATRRQMGGTVLGEGIIVALFGGLLGVGLGLIFGVACVRIIPDDFVGDLAIPWGSLVGYLIISAFAGLFAAIFPAWRAGRMNVLEAISQG